MSLTFTLHRGNAASKINIASVFQDRGFWEWNPASARRERHVSAIRHSRRENEHPYLLNHGFREVRSGIPPASELGDPDFGYGGKKVEASLGNFFIRSLFGFDPVAGSVEFQLRRGRGESFFCSSRCGSDGD